MLRHWQYFVSSAEEEEVEQGEPPQQVSIAAAETSTGAHSEIDAKLADFFKVTCDGNFVKICDS